MSQPKELKEITELAKKDPQAAIRQLIIVRRNQGHLIDKKTEKELRAEAKGPKFVGSIIPKPNPELNLARFERIARELDANLRKRAEAKAARAQEMKTPEEVGRRFWVALRVDELEIAVNRKKITVKQALDECVGMGGKEKARRLREILIQIGDRFRINENHENSFGIRYARDSSSLEKIITDRTFNCFSASTALALLSSYAIERTGMGDSAAASVQMINYFRNPEKMGRWDDSGHAETRVYFTSLEGRDRELFLDSTFIGNPAKSRGNCISPSNAMRAARIQQDFFDGEPVASEDVKKLPGVFIYYYVSNLSRNGKTEFFQKLGERGMENIAVTGTRYKLAASAAMLFAEINPELAKRFSLIALRALNDAMASDEHAKEELPGGAFLGVTADLIEFARKRIKDSSLIDNERVYGFMVSRALAFTAQISPTSADKVAAFLLRFYQKKVNQGRFNNIITDAGNRNRVFELANALLNLSNIRKGGIAEGALNQVYADMGIDRKELITRLRKNIFFVSAGNGKLKVVPGTDEISYRIALRSRTDLNFELEKYALGAVGILLQGKSLKQQIESNIYHYGLISRDMKRPEKERNEAKRRLIQNQSIFNTFLVKDEVRSFLFPKGPLGKFRA